MTMPKFRTINDRLRVQSDPMRDEYPTQTQQFLGDEVDINTIMAKYATHQVLPRLQGGPGMYGDFTGVTDYHTALIQIEEAQQAFMDLPAKIRNRFENEPQQLITFLENEDNLDEARELGLVEPSADHIPTREETPSPANSEETSEQP